MRSITWRTASSPSNRRSATLSIRGQRSFIRTPTTTEQDASVHSGPSPNGLGRAVNLGATGCGRSARPESLGRSSLPQWRPRRTSRTSGLRSANGDHERQCHHGQNQEKPYANERENQTHDVLPCQPGMVPDDGRGNPPATVFVPAPPPLVIRRQCLIRTPSGLGNQVRRSLA
jgi:hypothetical protein